MKKSRCPHRAVYRERGPQVIWTEKNYHSQFDIAAWALVVWEVCVKCGRRKRVPFKLEKGAMRRPDERVQETPHA